MTFGYLVSFFQLSGAFLPVRVWAVQMGDKMFFLLFTGSAGRSSALKRDLFISFSILQLGFTITYVFFLLFEFDIFDFLGSGFLNMIYQLIHSLAS